MARREITQYFDDLDDTPLEEHELHVVRFSYEGSDYLLDLSEENAEKFREMINPYIEVARPAPQVRNRIDAQGPLNSRDIRRWAMEKGMKVANRGKIPFDIIEAYKKAHL